MYRKLGGRKILLLVAAFLSTAGVVPAQGTFDSPPASVTILDSTKDLDGLLGSVRRVKTESAKLEIKEGRLFEGPRQLVEVTTYALTGNRIENVSYPVANSPVGREEYKYDEKGHMVEMTLRGDGGAILSREAYDYEFDRFGNWTKMVTNLVVFEDGQLKREPVEITYRSLTYYFDENIASAVAAPAGPRGPSQPAARGLKAPDRSSFSGSSNQLKDGAVASIAVDNRSAEITPTTREGKSAPAAASEKLASINSPGLKEVGTSNSVGPKSAPEEKKLDPRPVHLSETTAVPKSTLDEKQPESLAIPIRGNPSVAKSPPDDKRLESRPKENLNVAKSSPEEKLEPRPIPVKENSSIPRSVPEEKKLEPKPVSVKEPTGEVKSSTAANRNPPSTASPGPGSPGANAGTTSPPPGNLTPIMRALAYYKKASELFEVGDIRGSVAVYLQAIELEPKSAEFRLALGHAYLKLQQDKEAAKALKESVQLNPEVAEAQYGLGLANFRLGRHKDAADAFKKATLLQADMAKAHFGLGLAYQELGKGDGLVEQYRILQRLDSNLAKQLALAFPEFNLPCKVPPFCK